MVTITPVAEQKIQELMKEEKDVVGLRIYVRGGGCHGYQYGMAFESKMADDDTVIEKGDVKVIGAAGDFAMKKVRGYGGPHLSRGVVLGISALWLASWLFLRPDILDWRLLGLILLIAGPPILLWRLTRP